METRQNRIEGMLKDLMLDLEAMHEYYCKYNCGTILKTHSPRCEKLQREFGFVPQKKASIEDIAKA